MNKLMIKEGGGVFIYLFWKLCPAWPPRFEQSFTVNICHEIDSIKISGTREKKWHGLLLISIVFPPISQWL